MVVKALRPLHTRSCSVETVAAMEPGIRLARKLVAAVIGPAGRSVLIGNGPSAPLRSVSGYSVLQQVELADRRSNTGLSIMRELAWGMKRDYGDGTSLVVLIAAAMLTGARSAIASGLPASALADALRIHGKRVVAALRERGGTGQDVSTLTAIARQAAAEETALSLRLAEATVALGPDAFYECSEGTLATDVIILEKGYKIEGGWVSSRLAGPAGSAVYLDDPLIILHPARIDSLETVEPVMRLAADAGRSLLFLTEDLSGHALATLIVNRQAGLLKAAAARIGLVGNARLAMLRDLCALTGAQVIDDMTGTRLSELRPRMLGRAGRVIVKRDATVIESGYGEESVLASHIEAIRADLRDDRLLELDRERVLRRLAMMAAGVIRVEIGNSTKAEHEVRTERCRSMTAALSGARKGGVIHGGASAAVFGERFARPQLPSGPLGRAIERIFADGLSAPLRSIAESVGEDGDWVVERIRQEAANGLSFDAVNRNFVDHRALADPLDILVAAISRAVSAIVTLLTAERLIVGSSQ